MNFVEHADIFKNSLPTPICVDAAENSPYNIWVEEQARRERNSATPSTNPISRVQINKRTSDKWLFPGSVKMIRLTNNFYSFFMQVKTIMNLPLPR